MQPAFFNINEHYGLLTVQGKDAEKFLQGLLTCDIQSLATRDYCLGAFCNLKGRARALFKIFKKEEAFCLELPRGLVPIILPALKKYAMFSKVSIEDSSDRWNRWGVVRLAGKALMLEHLLPDSNITVLMLDEALPRFELIGEITTDTLPVSNLPLMDHNTWNLFNIRAGIPEIWPETTEQFLPHHLHLPQLGAVSFTKGCYCGQEIIARMEYKGKIKYDLKHIIFKDPEVIHERDLPAKGSAPLPGTELEVGKVVTAVLTAEGNVEALVVHRRDETI
jgi:folate-binding protein YgfZ